MRFGSVCSGIECASVAWHPLGWRAAWLSEIDAAASAVLAHRFPDVQNLGDMTAIAPMIETGIVEAPDILVGGTPCQGFSVAGRRGGLSDPRGQLTLSYVEILDAIDDARRADDSPPCIAVWENVPGVLSMGDNAFGNFLAALAGEDDPLEPSGKKWPDAGLVVGPKRAIAWRILDAQYLGLAQRRRRVFLVASARDGFDPGEILFEFDGVRRDSPPSRQAGQEIAADAQGGTGGRSQFTHDLAPYLTESARGLARTGDPRGQDPVVGVRLTNRLSRQAFGGGNCSGPIAAAAALNANERYDFDSETFIVEPQCVTGDITHTLTAEGFDASEDGTGRGQPIVPATAYRTSGNYGAYETGDKVHALTTGTDPCSHLVTFQGRGSNLMVDDDLAGTLTQNCDRASGGAPCVAFTAKDHGQDATEELSPTLRAGDGPIAGALAAEAGAQQQTYVASAMAVRRLLPVETERLQGFPDGWTRIPIAFHKTRKVTKLRPEDMWEPGIGPDGSEGWWLMAADGPRYKQCGNSMARNCMAWIGWRVKQWLELEPFRELIG